VNRSGAIQPDMKRNETYSLGALPSRRKATRAELMRSESKRREAEMKRNETYSLGTLPNRSEPMRSDQTRGDATRAESMQAETKRFIGHFAKAIRADPNRSERDSN
jgi:hypothetical protein